MTRMALFTLLLGAAWGGLASHASAQVDVTLPGGATGEDVYCIQAGDLTTGAFIETFLQTGKGKWEQRSETDTFKLEETSRDALMVELLDPDRKTSFQFNFVDRNIKDKSQKSKDWIDRSFMLSASAKELADDCIAFSKPRDKAAGGSGSGGGKDSGPGTVVQYITIAPKTKLDIKPGTQLTATNGPPCPGNPGFFLCPNKFSCAPAGGVCCPGAGTCSAGTFCDLFVKGNCIVPGNPRFCPGSGNIKTGLSLHCPPGKSCGAGNLCN
jgi:hypothetical protein